MHDEGDLGTDGPPHAACAGDMSLHRPAAEELPTPATCAPGASPSVSVIVPVYNEEKHVAECIESVVGQTYPKERLEVFLIDGGSQDRTREIIGQYQSRHPFLKLLDNPRRVAPAALNIGVQAATGEVVIRLDAHTYYDREYIAKCVETLRTVDAANVGGPITTLPGDETLMAEAIAIATSHPFGVGNSKFRTSRKAQYVDTVPFGAFRREIFSRIGLFNEALIRNQDIEFNNRIRRNGGTIFLNPEIKSFYYNQATLRGLWRQNFKNGLWNIYTHALCHTRLSTRHYVPLLFVTSLALGLGLSLFTPVGVILFGAVAFSYLACSAYFSTQLAWRRPKLLPLLPLVFLTLHFSYGTGSLVGLLRWRSFRRARGGSVSSEAS